LCKITSFFKEATLPSNRKKFLYALFAAIFLSVCLYTALRDLIDTPQINHVQFAADIISAVGLAFLCYHAFKFLLESRR
jgi:hypothetical protein